MLEDAGYERSFVRIGGASAIVGAVLGMVGNLLHPVTPIDDPEGVRESSPTARSGLRSTL